LWKQYKEANDDVVNLTSPTFTILDVEEGMNGMDVFTNSLKEWKWWCCSKTSNIVNEDEGKFKVIKNQLGSITKNASKILSIPSAFVTHGQLWRLRC
jgi:hypothetical protein